MTCRANLQLFALICLVAAPGYAQQEADSYPGNARYNSRSSVTSVEDRHGSNPPELQGPAKLNSANGHGQRLREGMKFVNQIGELKEAGGRILFYPDGYPQSLQLLENLALERVSEELNEPHRKWSVTGVVTEYLGSNYLLLHRAVLKARVTGSSVPRS